MVEEKIDGETLKLVFLKRLRDLKKNREITSHPLGNRVAIRFLENCQTHHAIFPPEYERRGLRCIASEFFRFFYHGVHEHVPVLEIDQYLFVERAVIAMFTDERSVITNKVIFLGELSRAIRMSLPVEIMSKEEISEFSDDVEDLVRAIQAVD